MTCLKCCWDKIKFRLTFNMKSLNSMVSLLTLRQQHLILLFRELLIFWGMMLTWVLDSSILGLQDSSLEKTRCKWFITWPSKFLMKSLKRSYSVSIILTWKQLLAWFLKIVLNLMSTGKVSQWNPHKSITVRVFLKSKTKIELINTLLTSSPGVLIWYCHGFSILNHQVWASSIFLKTFQNC